MPCEDMGGGIRLYTLQTGILLAAAEGADSQLTDVLVASAPPPATAPAHLLPCSPTYYFTLFCNSFSSLTLTRSPADQQPCSSAHPALRQLASTVAGHGSQSAELRGCAAKGGRPGPAGPTQLVQRPAVLRHDRISVSVAT
ncbi:hypothetical protein HaLaN_04622 [Haematococcus lacustris]|uniref:Uncharacterized protein n=1 Tax=Haematococcus lacustris TaxID=44745 RepID=A0A699YH95_HAELA|nr:hypothetical protein HaLaN_04622 [Haematococcus lacustris]